MCHCYLATGTLILLIGSGLTHAAPTVEVDLDQPLPALSHALRTTSHFGEGMADSESRSIPASWKYIYEYQIKAVTGSETHQIPPPSPSNPEMEMSLTPVHVHVAAAVADESRTQSKSSGEVPKRKFPSYLWINGKYVYDADLGTGDDHREEVQPGSELHNQLDDSAYDFSLVAQRIEDHVLPAATNREGFGQSA